MVTRLFLVRHGATSLSAEDRFAGWTDIDLSAEGREQVHLTITVLDDGRTRFAPAADGKHRYLIVDPAQKERITTLYTAMVSAPPAPRPQRGRGAQE